MTGAALRSSGALFAWVASALCEYGAIVTALCDPAGSMIAVKY
jgi:hypothetical protein